MEGTPHTTTPGDQELPEITEKQVSWQEAVAAELVRRRHRESGGGLDQGHLITMLAAPAVERMTVAGLLLEPYSLAHSLLLEQLQNPFEIGGSVELLDIAVALLAFGERELLQGLVATHGAAQARALLYASPAAAEVLARITRDSLPVLRAWLAQQFGSVSAGETDAAEAAEEAAVAAAEEAAKKPVATPQAAATEGPR